MTPNEQMARDSAALRDRCLTCGDTRWQHEVTSGRPLLVGTAMHDHTFDSEAGRRMATFANTARLRAAERGMGVDPTSDVSARPGASYPPLREIG